ncbi:MAG: DUF3298 domain-containing protein [Massiliimalia sp.]|jgi:hypothetical protein
MMKPLFEHEKNIYESTPIPEELPYRVKYALSAGKKQKRRPYLWLKTASASLAACCAAFVITLNASPVFAESVSTIPVLGDLAKIVTFRQVQTQDDVKIVNVKIPELKNTGNTQLEKRVNEQIQTKMDQLLEESKQIAQEDYEAFIETGGNKEDFHPVDIILDYQIHHSDENTVSFEVIRFIGSFSAYTEKMYYNLDLKTGKDITLQDVLGENYKQIANEQITKQINAQLTEDPSRYFVDENGQLEFQSISDHQNFYLNEEGKPVVVFDKYEIAPGSTGFPEFVIQ